MKAYSLVLTLLVVLNLGVHGQNYNDSIRTKIIKANNIKDLKHISWNFCDTCSIEILGLYPTLETLPNLQNDQTIIKSLLIKNGFT